GGGAARPGGGGGAAAAGGGVGRGHLAARPRRVGLPARGHRRDGGGARGTDARRRPEAAAGHRPRPVARVVLGAVGLGERVDERRGGGRGARVGRPAPAPERWGGGEK